MDKWIKNANDNHTLYNTNAKCTVFLKKGTKNSWQWVINHQKSTHFSTWTYSSAAKAKKHAGYIMFTLSLGVSWMDAIN